MKLWQQRLIEQVASGKKTAVLDRLLPQRKEFARDLENLAALVCYTAQPITAPAALRARVMAALAREEKKSKQASVVAVQAEARRWRRLLPGIEVCILSRAKNYRTVLLKIKAGYTLPGHPHLRTEHAFVLEGACWSGKLKLKAGDFLLSVAGTLHAPVKAIEDCVILIVAHR